MYQLVDKLGLSFRQNPPASTRRPSTGEITTKTLAKVIPLFIDIELVLYNGYVVVSKPAPKTFRLSLGSIHGN